MNWLQRESNVRPLILGTIIHALFLSNVNMRVFFPIRITLSSPPLVITSFIRHTHHLANPKASHFLALLNLCRTGEDLTPLSSFLFDHGLTNHVSLLHQFFASCLHFGASHLAISTFQHIKRPSLTLQNLLIRCLCNAGLYQDVLCVYMRSRMCDDYTFPFLIKACAALRDFEFGKVVHGVVFRIGFVDNLVIQTSLVDFYAKTGCVEVARKVIDGISHPDLVPWNALIAGCSSNGFDWEALEIFREIVLSDFQGDFQGDCIFRMWNIESLPQIFKIFATRDGKVLEFLK